MNPILRGDLRARVASPKALTVYTIFLGVLGVLVVLSLPPDFSRADEVRGEGLLLTVLIVQAVLVAYFTSATASGEIALEGDKSVEDLVTSPFSARAIGVGKIASAFCFAGSLVLFAAPVVAVVAGVRGEPLGQIVRAAAVAALIGGTAGALGTVYGAVFESDFSRSFVLWLTLFLLVVAAAALPEPWNTISPVRAIVVAVRGGAPAALTMTVLGYALLTLASIWALRRRVEVIRQHAGIR